MTLCPFLPTLLSTRQSARLPACKFLLHFACLARALAALRLAPALVVFVCPRVAPALVVLASHVAPALVVIPFPPAVR